jgi:hypothetical protein
MPTPIEIEVETTTNTIVKTTNMRVAPQRQNDGTVNRIRIDSTNPPAGSSNFYVDVDRVDELITALMRYQSVTQETEDAE